MGILVGKDTRLVVQGITGREGGPHRADAGVRHAARRRASRLAEAGPRPRACWPTTASPTPSRSRVSTPRSSSSRRRSPGDAMIEAAAAGLRLVICITEGVPRIDTVRAVRFIEERGTARLIGPNCPGCDDARRGTGWDHAVDIFRRGTRGVVSRSGTLTYEVVDLITKAGLGVSTCVGVGGDPVIGTSSSTCSRCSPRTTRPRQSC